MGLIEFFDSVIINAQENPFILRNIDNKKLENLKQTLFSKGFYDGRITCIKDFEIRNQKLILSCVDASFFEFNFARDFRINFPRPIAVNAMIQTENKGTILLKRGEDTYCYQDYWDFPAGLIPFKTPLLKRMLGRIENELGLNQDCLEYSKYPNSFELKDEFFMFYYKMKCKLPEDKVREILSKSENSTIILKKPKIPSFLRSNQVYPTFLGD